jgi:tetratricopeptide (TPR) repeat protein
MDTKIARTIERLETALMIRPDDRHQRVQLGRAYQQAKRYPDAEEAYQRVLRVEPNSAEAQFSLGLLRSEQGRSDEALELYQRTIASDGEHLGARRALAEHAVQGRDFAQAREHYETLVRLQPREAESLRALASVLVQLGDDSRAAELLERALELDPSDLGCVQELCACWFRTKAWQRISDLALPLVDEAKLANAVVEQLGHATRELVALDNAERAFRVRLSRGETVDAHCGLAWVFLQRKRYPDVIKQLERLSDPSLEAWYLRGQAFFHLGKWSEAADCLREAVERAPGDGNLHHWLGLSLLELGRLDEAVTHLRHAVRYFPRSVDSWVGLSQALVRLEQWDSASEPMQQAIALEPEKAAHHARLGQHQVRLARFDLAQVSWSRAVELSPFQGEYWLALGETKIRLEQFDSAEQDLVRATQMLPSSASGWAALGLARARLRKFQEAIPALEQAVHFEPNDLASRLGLARVFIELGRFPDALTFLEKTPAALAASADVVELSGQTLFELRRYEQASAALIRRTSLPKPNASSWVFLGLSQEQLGKHAEGEAALARAVELDGVAAPALAGLGRCRIFLRNPSGAIEPLERLVRLTPRDVASWRLLGQAYGATGALREARDSLDKAIALAPNDALTLEQYGLTLAALGDADSAFDHLTKACQLEPRLEQAWRKLAELNETKRQLPAAIDAWRKVLGIAPRDRDALGKLAELYFQTRDFVESLAVWRRALQDNSNDVAALVGQAAALSALKRDPESVDVLRQVLRLEPNRDAQALELGQALLRLGQYEEAETWLVQANTKQPTADGYEQIATCRERLKRPADEAEALEACLGLAPARGHLWRRLGLVALQLGYRPRGIVALERALELGQNDATLQTKLAEALRLAAREFRSEGANGSALDALERSERFHSNDPALFVELSSVLEALERPEDAIERIKRASILAPDNAEYVLRLGSLLLAQNELQSAHASFLKATEMSPNSFDGWVGLGKALSGLGKIRAAIEAYRKALALRDSAGDERFAMAVWLAEEGMFREAAPELERVLRDDSSQLDAARWLGRCLTRLEQVEPSAHAWRAVLRLEATDVEALMGLARAQWSLGKPKEARFPLQQLIEQLESGELSTPPRGFWELWGRVLFALGEHALSESALQRATAESNNQEVNADLGTQRATSLVQLSRFDEALHQVDALLVAAPSDATLLQLRAQALAGAGQTDAAVVALKRVLDGASHGAEERRVAAEKLASLYKEQAVLALDSRDTRRAETTLGDLIALCAKYGVAGYTTSEGAAWYGELIGTYRSLNNQNAAQAAARTALTHFPNDARLHFAQAELWAQVGVWDEALDAYAKSAALHGTVAAWLGQGQALLRLQRFDDARSALEQGLQLGAASGESATALAPLHQLLVEAATAVSDPSLTVKHLEGLGKARALVAGEWRSLGFALQSVGRHADAVEAFEAVLDEHPKDGDVRFALARALHRGQRGRAALVPLKQLVKDEPARGEAWLELARRSTEADELSSAVAAYEEVSALLSPQAEVAREWVEAAAAIGDPRALERALRYACRTLPADYELRLRLASVLEQLGEEKAAIDVLSALLEQAPNELPVARKASHQLASLELGYGQTLVERDPEQARWVLSKAGEHALGDPATVLAVVQELIELGANAVAISLCDRGLEVSPSADELALCLGGIATKRGEYVRAAEAYERVVGRKPDLVHALLSAGRARLTASQPELAQVWLKRAAHLEPGNHEVAALLEKATSLLGRTDDTLLAQEALLQVNPRDAELHQRYVRLLSDQGHHDRVAAAVRRAESLVGPIPELLALGSRALRASGRYAEAVQWAERALAVAPREPTALAELGASQIELGELEAGVESLLLARAAQPDIELGDALPLGLVGRGRLRLQRGNVEQAASDFDQALREGAEPLAILPSLVNAARRARQLARALTAARELANLQSTAVNLMMVGDLCLELGQPHEAAAAFESAIQLEISGEGYLGLGTAYYRMNDARARLALRRSIELRPGAEAYELLANIHERAGEWSDAASSLLALASHRELTDIEQPRLAAACERAGDLAGAARAWRSVVQRLPGDTSALWELGRIELLHGNPEAAVTAFESVLAQTPYHPQASGALGRALAQLGRPQEALVALERQIQRGTDPELLKLIAEQQKRLGQASNSIESLERVVHLEPRNGTAYRELAVLLMGASRHTEAVAAARRTVAIHQDDAARDLLGETLARFAEAAAARSEREPCRSALIECLALRGVTLPTLGMVLMVALAAQEADVAVRTANHLIDVEPEDLRLHQALARACSLKKEWLKAGAALEMAVNLSLRHQARPGKALPEAYAVDSTPELLIQWAKVLEGAGQLVTAAQTADRAIRLGSTDASHRLYTAEVHYRVAEDQLGQGFPERAVPFLDRAAELTERRADVAFLTALAHRLMGNTERAVEAAQACLLFQPDHLGAFRVGKELLAKKLDAPAQQRLRAWFEAYPHIIAKEANLELDYGTLLAAMNQHDAARRVLRPLLDKPDARDGATLALADSYLATKEWEQQVQVLSAASKRAALKPAYQRRLVEALEKVGRFDEAAVALAHLLESEPKDVDELMRLASLELEVKREQDALANVERALNHEPTHLPALRMKSWLLKELERPAERILVLEQLIELDPQAREMEELGDVCLGLRRTTEAEMAMSHWARQFPKDPRAHLRCGLVRAQWGDPNLAIESLEQALRLDKNLEVARLRIAEIYDGMIQRLLVGREYVQALEESERWSRSLPGDPDALHKRAECLQALGRSFEAVALWRAVIAANPGHAPSVQMYAAHLVGSGRSDEAEAALATALGSNRESIELMSSLVQLYVNQRKFEQAEIVANRAVRLAPDNVDILVLLSQIAANTSRPTEAEEHLRRALRANPNHSEANYTLGKLYLALGRHDLARGQLDKLKRINSPRAEKLASRLNAPR